ncbi:hypothetical protein SH139x_004808 [Planctomycetaceae bacterium SH139]
MNNDQIALSNELPASVLRIVQRVRSQPVQPGSLDRALARAVLLGVPQQKTAVQGSAAQTNRVGICRWTWRHVAIVGLASAAAILLIAVLLPTQPSLAQSLSATKAQPWLSGKVTYVVDGGEHKYVFWFSAAKRRFALKLDNSSVLVRFGETLEDNRMETYDKASGETMTQEDVTLRQQDLHLLRTLLAGDALSEFSESEAIVSQRPGYERYRVKLKNDDSGAEHVITVSRESGLLHSWEVEQPDGMTTMTLFEYPLSGPENIDALEKAKEPSASSGVDDSQSLKIVPAEGINAIRFGSSIADVRIALGEPTKEKALGTSAREMVYAELGLVLLVHSKHGVGDIQCCSDHARYSLIYGVTMKAFPGKTKEGIGIGSTREEILAAYGEPTSHNRDGSIGYSSQHIGYEFIDSRISRIGMRARSSGCVSNENENAK